MTVNAAAWRRITMRVTGFTTAWRIVYERGAAEAEGCVARVVEFVAPDHTRKNKIILGMKLAAPLAADRRAGLRRQIAGISSFFGVREQCLLTLFGVR